MAVLNVNPTRMELTRLKKQLNTAVRGHKLLKDKRDELMRQFFLIVRENKELRAKVEKGIEEANRAMTVASSVMSPEMLQQALLYPKQSATLDMTFQNIMSVSVPVYEFHTKNEDAASIYPYGFAQTSGELDDALGALASVFQDMLALAQAEKKTQLLASEIEKTRRRVNALEHVMIPDLQTNIKYRLIICVCNMLILTAIQLYRFFPHHFLLLLLISTFSFQYHKDCLDQNLDIQS